MFFYSLFLCDGHLGCFHFLAVVHNAATSTDVQVAIKGFLVAIKLYHRSVAGSYGGSVFTFFEKPTDFHSGCTRLHCQQQ